MMGGGGEIPIPFRKVLQPGESDFEVPVHRAFCRDRCFSFVSLSVVPGYFEQQAAKLDMDTEAELDSETTEYVDCRAVRLHQIADIMEGPKPDLERTFKIDNYNNMTLTSEYVEKFNNFFLDNKPPHMLSTPFFLDWMDARFEDKPLDKLIDSVKKNLANYYQVTDVVKEFTAGIHDSGLPAGLRALPDANYLAFPDVPFSEDITERIFLRLHLAPMTKLISSTANIFEFFGFDVEAQRARNTGDHHSQIVFLNDTYEWMIIPAFDYAPQKLDKTPTKQKKAQAAIKHRIRMGHARNEVGAEQVFQMSERTSRKNALLMPEIEPLFTQITKMTNIKFGIDFNQAESKYKIRFPPDVSSRVLMSPNLQKRLGMGSHQAVIVTTESEARMDADVETTSDLDTTTMARALVLDTGMSICTPARGVTSSAMFLADNYMAMLLPSVSGTLDMKENSCAVPNRVVFDDLRFGSENVARLQFRLHRYLNNGDIVPFGWKVNSYVTGILLCTPMAV
jgi:hypothetical protein